MGRFSALGHGVVAHARPAWPSGLVAAIRCPLWATVVESGGPRFQRMVGRSVRGLGLAHSLRTFDHPCRRRFVDSPRHPRDAGVPTALGPETYREGPDREKHQEPA